MATEIVPSSMATTNDTGYLGFKMAKLGEMTLGIRKELDEMQLWRDRVSDCEVGHACSVSQSFIVTEPASHPVMRYVLTSVEFSKKTLIII